MAGPLDALGGFIPDPVAITGGIAQFMQGMIYVVIIGVVFFLLMKFKILYKYPVEIDIFQVRKGVLSLVDRDTARRVKKKDGEEYYDVKKRNFKWHPPTFEGQLDLKGGKKTKLYVQELSHNEWKIIDPTSFIKAKPEDYQILERESLVRYWKNLEDAKDDVKWKKEDKLKALLNLLPTVIMFVGIGIFIYFFGTYVITPVLGYANMGQELLTQSMALLEKSTEYVELIMANTNASYVPSWVNTTNESVIA